MQIQAQNSFKPVLKTSVNYKHTPNIGPGLVEEGDIAGGKRVDEEYVKPAGAGTEVGGLGSTALGDRADGTEAGGNVGGN